MKELYKFTRSVWLVLSLMPLLVGGIAMWTFKDYEIFITAATLFVIGVMIMMLVLFEVLYRVAKWILYQNSRSQS